MSLDRFLRKQADLSTILPAVAGPAIGGFAGRAIGGRYNAENLGAMLGGITGGVTGQLVKERLENKPQMPAGAPFAVDPTTADIPSWALQGVRLLKQSSQLSSVIGNDVGGFPYSIYEGMRDKLPQKQIAKNVLGQSAGVIGGGLLGHAAGGLVDKFIGAPVKGPFGVPLSTLLAGLGATIGNVKGLEYASK